MNTCLNCEESYEAKRHTSKFCSDRCRVAYNRKNRVVKEKEIEKGIMEILGDTKAAIKQMASDLLMFGQARTDGQQLIKGFGPDTQFKVMPVEEPLSFDKMREEVISKPSYLQFLNGMASIHFSDEKEEYATKIIEATHLSDKQREALLNHLKYKQ